ncbi:hypothetical protein POTOM_013957 [Populus tomentosa]|uniref:Uncharacterized protein n=1 Tax=Populus tomentosa TaxID=118781 RepID=A0A8X8D7E4_POPTO|nr:hypothetical protein POTOM_013957 [Populus tomentosa]
MDEEAAAATQSLREINQLIRKRLPVHQLITCNVLVMLLVVFKNLCLMQQRMLARLNEVMKDIDALATQLYPLCLFY